MKKIAIFSVFLLAGMLFSCEKNDLTTNTPQNTIQQKKNDDVKVVNGRLVFESDEIFTKIYSDLVQKSVEDLDKWAKQYDFISLFNAIEKRQENDIYLNNMAQNEFVPYSIKRLANANGEIKIGNKIYWFNGNKSYVVSSETELNETKNNPSSNKSAHESKITKLDSKKLKNFSVILEKNGGLDARYQYQFPYNSSFEFKYVHEVVTSHIYVGGQFHSAATVHIKFEYKNPSACCWNQAGDTRDVNYSISGSVYFIDTQYFSKTSNGLISTNVSPYPVNLYTWHSPSNTNNDMTINVSGTIYQKAYINGVAQVSYTTSNTPLW